MVNQRGWLAERSDGFRAQLLRHAQVRHFESDETLYLEGDLAEGVYAVIKGSVKVTVPGDDGQDVVVHRGADGFWIGDLAMLSGQTRLVTVVATSRLRCLYVPTVRIREMVEETPAYYEDFYALTHANMRLALRLLHQEEIHGTPGGWLPLLQEDLAEMVAMSVPTLQRILRKLSDQGVIELGYGKLRILNRNVLIQLCQS